MTEVNQLIELGLYGGGPPFRRLGLVRSGLGLAAPFGVTALRNGGPESMILRLCHSQGPQPIGLGLRLVLVKDRELRVRVKHMCNALATVLSSVLSSLTVAGRLQYHQDLMLRYCSQRGYGAVNTISLSVTRLVLTQP